MMQRFKDEKIFTTPERFAIAATLATFITWVFTHFPLSLQYSDVDYYLALANGHADQVMQPFSYRVLNPWLVNRIATFWSMTIPEAFYYISLGWICAFTFCVAVPLLHLRRSLALASLAAIVLTPFDLKLFSFGVLPDLSCAALLAIYFLLLRARMWWQASIFLIFLYLDRESTLLLAIVAIVVLWKMEGRYVGILHAICAVIGLALSSLAGSHGQANRQGLPNMLYTIGKIPWQFLRNILGIEPWVNTFSGTPPHVWQLPSWMHLGRLHAIGIWGWSSTLLLLTICNVLAIFGIGTLLVCMVWKRKGLRSFMSRESWLTIAGIYGAACFVLAPFIGSGVDRLIGYAWPLFFLWLPYTLQRILPADVARWRVLALLLLNTLAACSIDYGVQRFAGLVLTIPQRTIFACIFLFAAWLLLRPVFAAGQENAVSVR